MKKYRQAYYKNREALFQKMLSNALHSALPLRWRVHTKWLQKSKTHICPRFKEDGDYFSREGASPTLPRPALAGKAPNAHIATIEGDCPFNKVTAPLAELAASALRGKM